VRRLCFLHKGREPRRIVYCNISEHLAVQFNSRALQTINELAVRNLCDAAGGVDPDNPERPEIPLLQVPSDITVTQGFLDRFLSCPVKLGFC
jgi:hypothetical protein